jgi:hypothetical protein
MMMKTVLTVSYLDCESVKVEGFESVPASYDIVVADSDEAERMIRQVITLGYFRIDWPEDDDFSGLLREFIPLHRILSFTVHEEE